MKQSGPAGDRRVVSRRSLAEVIPEWNFKGMMGLSRHWLGKEYSRKRIQCDGSLSVTQGYLESNSK